LSNALTWSQITEKPVFSASILNQLVSAIGVEKTREFAKSYVQACKTQSGDLIQALRNKDYNQIEFISHKLTSSTGPYGSTQLQFINQYIEECAMNALTPQELDTDEKLQKLSDIIKASLAELEQHLSKI
jgi:HPt (histidine-containing phosphotransfer) domain-containing protein